MTRVRSGTLTVLVFALMFGLAGAYFVRQQLNRPTTELPPLAEPNATDIIVPVAATDLEPGRMVSINDVAILRLSPEAFAKSEYVNLQYMRSSEQIKRRVLRNGLKRGEVFLPTTFYPDGGAPGIDEMLLDGFRAVTIPIQHVGGVQGFARPNSFVDVLFRSEEDEERPEVTITLLERVKVLAVNNNIHSEQAEPLDQQSTVTLAVTPTQAKALKVVENRGELSLILRNPNDELDFLPVDLHDGRGARHLAKGEEHAELHPVGADGNPALFMGMERVTQGTDQVSLDDLLNIPPKPKPAKMIVYRGGSKEVITFDDKSRPAATPFPQMIRVPIDPPFVQQVKQGEQVTGTPGLQSNTVNPGG